MKKIISLFMATIVAAVLPFTCSAANIQNPKYKGVYWDTKMIWRISIYKQPNVMQ